MPFLDVTLAPVLRSRATAEDGGGRCFFTVYLWGKPVAPSEVEGNSGRRQNSPVDKPLKRPARLRRASPGHLAAWRPWNGRKGTIGRSS
jgi:hypothetical protein